MSKIINKEQELDNIINSSKEVLVLFYASWCPFSAEFLPVFEKYSQDKAQGFCRILTDKVEGCDEKYSVDVVPTVILFKNGKVSKRLDGVPGEGLDERQLVEMLDECNLKKGGL